MIDVSTVTLNGDDTGSIFRGMSRLVFSTRHSAMVLVMLLGAACGLPATPPGSERMGTYALAATLTGRMCDIDGVPDAGFTFEASFSRDPATNAAWVTLTQYSRDAGWNGQTLESTTSATRAFGGVCTSCPMALQETIRVDLLSQSQNLAAGGRCPDGEPPAVDPDAGIFAPGPDSFGYDAVRACGTLVTTTLITGALPDGGACDALCGQCTVQYRLIGDRR